MIEIRHTGMVTNNLSKSIIFWVQYLGFKISKELNESGDLIDKLMLYKNVQLKSIKLDDYKGNKIEILYFKNSPKIKKKVIKPYSNGFTHISLTVKSVMDLYKFLKKKKIVFNSKPKKSEDGKVLMTYCRTPEGAFLELVEELK